MDEGGKRVLLIAAAILAARKLGQMEGRMLASPAAESTIADAISLAEKTMRKIDAKWPGGRPQ